MAGTIPARSRRWVRQYELDAELTAATDALILQALSSVGWPQDRDEPIAAWI